MFALVLTYGVPVSLPDPNLDTYAIAVFTWLFAWTSRYPGQRATVALNGGATNPQVPITEAEVMSAALRRLFDRQFHENRRCIQFAYEDPKALDLWGSIADFRRLLMKERRNGEPIVIFCERHRRHRTRFVAQKILGPEMQFQLVFVDFDSRTQGFRDACARAAELGSAVMSWHLPLFYEVVERPRRMAKIGRKPDGTLITR